MACVGSAWRTMLFRSAVALLAAAFAAPGTANAQSVYHPSIVIGTAALIAPVGANTYYYSKAGWTDTNVSDGLSALTGVETPTPPEIFELANALHHDPDLIYQYVHNNVQTVWMYGLQKGALGAEIDKSGTPFDQAQLMMALLRQSGITASYIAGTVQFNQAQFNTWTGITSARAACQLLSSGAIPATVNGVNNASCTTLDTSAQVSTVEMAHIWLKVTISGTAYVFDPSYKTYNYKTGIPLATAMVFTPGDPLNHVKTGSYNTGADSGVPYVDALNASHLNTDLQGYASNLLAYIKSHNLQGAQMEDIVSGGVIVPDNSTLRQTTLPYADPTPPYVFHTWTPSPTDPARYNAIPDQYRTTLIVEVQTEQYNPDFSTFPAEMFNPTPFFADEIYGRRLTIETDFTGSGIGTESEYYNQRTCLALDAQDIASWSSPPPQCLLNYFYQPPGQDTKEARSLPAQVILTANHPYAASKDGTPTTSGDYMDATVNKKAKLITALTIVHGWGDTGSSLFSKWSEERVADSIQPGLNTAPSCPHGEDPGALCPQFYQKPTGNFGREKVAASWLAQFARVTRLNAAIANAVPQTHHVLGVVFGDATLQGISADPQKPPGFTIGTNFDRMDVDAGISLTSRTSSTSAPSTRRGAILAFAASSAALEGSMSGQLNDVVDMSSTATRFEWGNSPDPDHSSHGQNPFNLGPQKFYQYNSANAGMAAGPNGTNSGLTVVDGNAIGSCSGTGYDAWTAAPTLPPTLCYGTGGYTGLVQDVGNWVSLYAQAGFLVVASKEAYLGPGQRGGQFSAVLNQEGYPYEYSHGPGQQRGGALVALRIDGNGDPVEIAHVVVGVDGGTKGGGGGSQPDDKTSYDPATAADILKGRFVDRSKLLGVDLANGSLGSTSPVSISVGNGGFPYELSSGESWHPGTPPVPNYGPESPIAPQPGWTQSWLNSMSFSGSGMEAMGQSDIRGAIGAIVSLYAAQDIYQAPQAPEREVAGVLTQSWWAHQLSGNIATVNIGGSARQFVKIATGDWIEPGSSYATAVQTGTRVPYEEKCFRLFEDNVPYAPSRGWDSSQGGGVYFTVTNAQGDKEEFDYFENGYLTDDDRECGRLKGFRLKSWTFPYGVTVTPTYTPRTVGEDQLDALSAVSNTAGRSLNFTPTSVSAGARSITFSDQSTQPTSMTDAMTNTTSFTYQPAQALSATQRPVPYALLSSVTTPEHSSAPNVEYFYDTLGRINSVMDAVAIQQPGTRNPYSFFLADGTRGERDDPLGQPYTLVYDTYGHASRFVDEIGIETDALFDSRGRALQYVYPEGDCEAFAYDDQNNTTDFWKVDKSSSCNTGAGTSHVLHASATWDLNWNKPATVTDARGNVTALLYFPAGSLTGTSLLEKATRPTIPEGTPVYLFDYDLAGKLLDMTGPTGIVTHNTYGTVFGASENLVATTVDYNTGTGHLNLETQFGYDADGNVNLKTDPNTNITSTTWDANRRKAEDDHHTGATLNAAEKTLYDAVNRVTDDQVGTAFTGTTVSTWLTTKHTTYTPTSKVATVTDADSRVTATSYDDDDRTLTVTDPMTRKVHFTYCGAGEPNCAANQVEKEIRAWGSGNACAVSGTLQECYRRLTYFPNGEGQSIRDANGNTTNYGYDGWNRLNLTTFPDTTTEQLTPDPNGNITKRITRASQEIDYTYNALNWMREKDVVATSLDTTWQYYLDGRVNILQDNTGANDSITYGYDTAGRMTSTTTWQPGFGANRTMSYLLDANGNRIRLTWPAPDGTYFVGYCYDNLNRMVMAQDNATDCSSAPLATYAYDSQSRRTSVTYGNGASMTYPNYSDAGDLKTLNENFTGTSNDNIFTYGYSNAHETQTIATSNSAFFWEPATNSATSYTPNILNQYSAIGSQTTGGMNCQGAVQGLSYDCNGNLTFDGTFTYTYDAENRLLTAHKSVGGNVSATYLYDPLGRRTEKSGHGVTATYFLNDGADEVAEYDSTKTITRRIIPGPSVDEPIAIVTASTGAKEFFHTDKQGSVVAMSDASGNLAEGPITYDSWGNCFVALAACSGTMEPYRFTGRRYDQETGLYYYRARYYDPAKGRFLQSDPVGYLADLNLYAYSGNSPSDGIDPNGTCPPILHGCGSDTGDISEGVDVSVSGINSTVDMMLTPDIGSIGSSMVSGNAASQQGSSAVSSGATQSSSGAGAVNTGTSDELIAMAGPAPTPNFVPPTNPPSLPPEPSTLPPGVQLRVMPPTQQYPNGYWVIEKVMKNGGLQKLDPRTMKPGTRWDTHIPLPPPTGPTILPTFPLFLVPEDVIRPLYCQTDPHDCIADSVEGDQYPKLAYSKSGNDSKAPQSGWQWWNLIIHLMLN
jgi:RHS repeat-associated protein